MSENKRKVLVLDDEEPIRLSLKNLLDYEGYLVDTASNGKEALDLCINDKYQVILSDISMPEMDGISFLGHIKEVDPFAEVVIMTGFSTLYKAIECMKKGAFGYTKKPFEHDNLLLLIQKAAENSIFRRQMALKALKGR